MWFCFVARRSKLKCTARLGYCFLLVYTQSHSLGRRAMRPSELSCALLVRSPLVSPVFLLPMFRDAERASSNLRTHSRLPAGTVSFHASFFFRFVNTFSFYHRLLLANVRTLPNQNSSSSFTRTLAQNTRSLLWSLSQKPPKQSTWTRHPRALPNFTWTPAKAR